MTSHWDSEGVRERLSIEHFQPFLGDGGEAGLGEGGTVRFRVTDFEAECDGQTSILVGGEDAGGSSHTVAGWACATPASASS